MAERQPAPLGLAVPPEPQRAPDGSADLGRPRGPAPSSASTRRMPVRVGVNNHEIDAAWGMDVMVAPERQRQGLGDVLFRTWDRNVGASLGLGLSESSYRLFQKLKWPDLGPVPCLVKPLSRRALRRPHWPVAVNRFVSYVTLPWIRLVSRSAAARGRSAHHPPLRRAVHAPLGERAGASSRLRCGVTRPYLNWKYIQPPHVRYLVAVLERGRGRRRLRRLSPRAGAARPGDAAGRLFCRSGRRERGDHAAALDRSRSPGRRLRQDPDVLHARGLPEAPEEVRLLFGEVDDGVRRQGQCASTCRPRSTRTRAAGT